MLLFFVKKKTDKARNFSSQREYFILLSGIFKILNVVIKNLLKYLSKCLMSKRYHIIQLTFIIITM